MGKHHKIASLHVQYRHVPRAVKWFGNPYTHHMQSHALSTLKNDKPHGLAPTINNIAGSEHVPHALQKSQYHPALESMGLTVINYLTKICISG